MVIDSRAAALFPLQARMDSHLLDPTAAHEARGWLHTTRFLTTAPEMRHLPKVATPEIAFVGRSNVGKSTAINALTQQTQLAFASRRPGRSRDIYLFAGGRLGRTNTRLADLPGYGYAAVSRADKERWQGMLTRYLVQRPNLSGVVLLCDARHGLRPLDLALLEAVRPRAQSGFGILILMTKCDKLTRAEQARALAGGRAAAPDADVLLFSAPKRVGLDDASLWLHGHTHPDAAAPSATLSTKETTP
jgi:GTP-binding protein